MNGEVMFYKRLEKLPLGIKEWHPIISSNNNHFNNGLNRRMNHTNTHALRTLNLHRFVTQPGNFCCDDGTCITSGKTSWPYFGVKLSCVCLMFA